MKIPRTPLPWRREAASRLARCYGPSGGAEGSNEREIPQDGSGVCAGPSPGTQNRNDRSAAMGRRIHGTLGCSLKSAVFFWRATNYIYCADDMTYHASNGEYLL